MKFLSLFICLLILSAPSLARAQEDMFADQFEHVPQSHPLWHAHNFEGDLFGPAAYSAPDDLFLTPELDHTFYGADLFNPPGLETPPDPLFRWSGARNTGRP